MTEVLKAVSVALTSLLALLTSYMVGTVNPATPSFGSTVGQEYIATTTGQTAIYGNTITGTKLVKSGQGALGNIVITGANTGVVNIYDATTTSVLLRAPALATSSILVATLPASLAAGTYLFDHNVRYGVYLELVSGIMPTTTIHIR